MQEKRDAIGSAYTRQQMSRTKSIPTATLVGNQDNSDFERYVIVGAKDATLLMTGNIETWHLRGSDGI